MTLIVSTFCLFAASYKSRNFLWLRDGMAMMTASISSLGITGRQLVRITDDFNAVEIGADLQMIVVQKSDGIEIGVTVAGHISNNHFARVARADNNGSLVFFRYGLLGQDLQVKSFGNSQA